MSRHQRIATWIGCAIPAAYFGWHLFRNLPGAVDAVAFLLEVFL